MRRLRFIPTSTAHSSALLVHISLKQVNNFCSEDIQNKLYFENKLITEFRCALGCQDFTLATKKLNALKKIYQPTVDEFKQWSIDTLTPRKISSITHDALTFPTFLPSKKTIAITDAVRQIDELLSQPRKCLTLLKDLDTTLKKAHKNLASVKPGKGFFVSDKLRVPSAPKGEIDIEKFDHTLPDVIREKLIKYNIGKEIGYFSGFIETENANKIVKSGGLFCELPYEGNLILHGLYAHLIQWYILVAAYEAKLLRFDSNLTPSDILAASVDVTCQDDDNPLWSSLFDHATRYTASTPLTEVSSHFGKPHRLSTT